MVAAALALSACADSEAGLADGDDGRDQFAIYFETDADASDTLTFPARYGRMVTVDAEPVVTASCIETLGTGVHPVKMSPTMEFTLDARCTRAFGTATSQSIGRSFVVVLEGEPVTAPTIQGPILGGMGFIEYSESRDDTAAAVARIRAAAGI